jgi:hypothetical protein
MESLPQFTEKELELLDDTVSIGSDFEEPLEEIFPDPVERAAYESMEEKFEKVLSILRDNVLK